jgi:predicted AAA+ superfamily ATPase
LRACRPRLATFKLPTLLYARDTLLANTERFARGFAANNALLWGARGMGKSALVKAVHAEVNTRLAASPDLKPLKLIEIHREDIGGLPSLMSLVRKENLRFLIFCDDLSFDAEDTTYKSLKAALEGGIEGRPANALFYATSNRRHILPREMIENERATAINPDDVVQEKISLSDRFGLWLGFHACSQEDYLAMVLGYTAHLASPPTARILSARRLSGLSPAVRARAVPPGNIFRISREGSAERWRVVSQFEFSALCQHLKFMRESPEQCHLAGSQFVVSGNHFHFAVRDQCRDGR